MTDTKKEPETQPLPPRPPAPPSVAETARREIPSILEMISAVDEVDVEGIAPYDVAAGLAAMEKKP